jgi:hypothetical protein
VTVVVVAEFGANTVRTATRARGITVPCLLGIMGVVVSCGSVVPSTGESLSATGTTTSSTPELPRPCSFLTKAIAAQISGDTAMTNRATNVAETPSGYVACVFADTKKEANSVAVRIRRVSGGVDPSTLREAATYFSRGEPVQPFEPFSVLGVGDNALGETTPGVAFIVFSSGELLIYVGAASASIGAASLRAGVEHLAKQIAATLG